MAHFVQGEVDPWRWQVHAFQAGSGGAAPGQVSRLCGVSESR